MTNLTQHKRKGKCPEYKNEQCRHCLIPSHSDLQQIEIARLNYKVEQLKSENARLQDNINLLQESAKQGHVVNLGLDSEIFLVEGE